MISLRRRKDQIFENKCLNKVDKVDDLEMIKLSINSGPDEVMDDQMSKLLGQLRDFSLK